MDNIKGGKIYESEHRTGIIMMNRWGDLVVKHPAGTFFQRTFIFLYLFQLTEDSFLEVESGDITLTLPTSFPFRFLRKEFKKFMFLIVIFKWYF